MAMAVKVNKMKRSLLGRRERITVTIMLQIPFKFRLEFKERISALFCLALLMINVYDTVEIFSNIYQLLKWSLYLL